MATKKKAATKKKTATKKKAAPKKKVARKSNAGTTKLKKIVALAKKDRKPGQKWPAAVKAAAKKIK